MRARPALAGACASGRRVALARVLATTLVACSPEGGAPTSQRAVLTESAPTVDVTRLGSSAPDLRAREALLAAAAGSPSSTSRPIVIGEGAASAFAHPVDLPRAAGSGASPALTPDSFRHVVRSSEAVEVALRRTVYFDIVTRCTDAAGKVLPPEAIALSFLLDGTGALVASSVRTRIVVEGPGHAEAAACMARSLTGSGLRVPADAEGDVTEVETLVPSVD